MSTPSRWLNDFTRSSIPGLSMAPAMRTSDGLVFPNVGVRQRLEVMLLEDRLPAIARREVAGEVQGRRGIGGGGNNADRGLLGRLRLEVGHLDHREIELPRGGVPDHRRIGGVGLHV